MTVRIRRLLNYRRHVHHWDVEHCRPPSCVTCGRAMTPWTEQEGTP